MAKVPLLECLTRHSYRECLEKSSSPHPRPEDDTDEEGGGETSTQTTISCSRETLHLQKSPASGEPMTQDRSGGSSSSGGLKEALEDETQQEGQDKGEAAAFNVTLLDWINVQDRPNDVEAVVRKCFDSINRVSRERLTVNIFHFIQFSWMFWVSSCLKSV